MSRPYRKGDRPASVCATRPQPGVGTVATGAGRASRQKGAASLDSAEEDAHAVDARDVRAKDALVPARRTRPHEANPLWQRGASPARRPPSWTSTRGLLVLRRRSRWRRPPAPTATADCESSWLRTAASASTTALSPIEVGGQLGPPAAPGLRTQPFTPSLRRGRSAPLRLQPPGRRGRTRRRVQKA